MSNPNTFINNYSANIVQLVQMLATLRTQNDQLTEHPEIITDYFGQTSQSNLGGMPRNDIVAADVTSAQDAITQILFTFDSGTPTQKSKLFKMQP